MPQKSSSTLFLLFLAILSFSGRFTGNRDKLAVWLFSYYYGNLPDLWQFTLPITSEKTTIVCFQDPRNESKSVEI